MYNQVQENYLFWAHRNMYVKTYKGLYTRTAQMLKKDENEKQQCTDQEEQRVSQGQGTKSKGQRHHSWLHFI